MSIPRRPFAILLRAAVVIAVAALAAGLMAGAASAAGSGINVQFTTQEYNNGGETIISSSFPGCPTGERIQITPDWLFSGPTAHFFGTKVFDCGGSGQFDFAYDVIHHDGATTYSGTWKITGGTGLYQGMTGQGTLLAAINLQNAVPGYNIYTGSVRLAATKPTTSFDGAWHGTDLGDGSAQFLYVDGGSPRTVVYYDTSAFPCRAAGYSNPAALVTGTGIVGNSGTTMVATMTAVCVANPGVPLFGGAPITFNLWVNSDGSISDDQSGGAFWLRGAA